MSVVHPRCLIRGVAHQIARTSVQGGSHRVPFVLGGRSASYPPKTHMRNFTCCALC